MKANQFFFIKIFKSQRQVIRPKGKLTAEVPTGFRGSMTPVTINDIYCTWIYLIWIRNVHRGAEHQENDYATGLPSPPPIKVASTPSCDWGPPMKFLYCRYASQIRFSCKAGSERQAWWYVGCFLFSPERGGGSSPKNFANSPGRI